MKVDRIALFGQMGSGKSTIANELQKSDYVRLSFADPLKGVAALAYGEVQKQAVYTLKGRDGLDYESTGREILQNVGQYIKNVDRDFWLRCFLRTATNWGKFNLVVDDGRFAFERDALRENGWLIVGVSTPRETRRERYYKKYGVYPTDREESHESEVEIPEIIRQSDVIVDGTRPASEIVENLFDLAGTANSTQWLNTPRK